MNAIPLYCLFIHEWHHDVLLWQVPSKAKDQVAMEEGGEPGAKYQVAMEEGSEPEAKDQVGYGRRERT